MHRLLFTAFFAAALLSAQNAPVPPAYQDLYNTLSTQISSFDSAVRANWDGSSSPVLYAPQLLSANSTEYTKLISPNYYASVVLPSLQALRALGSKGVTVHINFPILYQPYYASDPSQYQNYVDFYQQLARDVRARGMKLIVESTVGSSFFGNEADSFSPFLKTLSWSDYMTGRAQNALNVARLIQPDYMAVITEPDTEASASGQANAGTVNGSTQLLQTILNTIRDGGVTQVAVGAGAGTWINSFNQYIRSFAATSVQFVDMHVYPVNRTYLTAALSAADTIHAAGKQVSISEAWAYKVRDAELGKVSYTDLYARDSFSFWAPIDTAFLKAMADLANSKNLAFLSPFWSNYLASYVDYRVMGASSAADVMNSSYRASGVANATGSFSSTGLAWMNRTIAAPDSSAPALPASPVAPAVFPSALQLSWPETADNVGVAAYRVYRNGALVGTTNLPTFAEQGLTPGATYRYAISAFDATGNVSGVSAPLTVQTVNTTPPSVPGNLSASAKSRSSIALTWTASTGIGGVGGYRLLRGTSPSALSIYANPTTTSFTDSNCRPATTYYYAVESFNPNGVTSAPSRVVGVTTLMR